LPIRPRALAPLLIAAALAAASGCGDDSSESGQSTAPAGTGSTETATTATTTTGTGSTDPLDGAGTEPVSAPAQSAETALLERIAVARHEGYDRVVFQFRNVLPGYRVSYAEGPLKEDGSGAPVKIDGKAVLVVRMEPASGFDLTTGEGELVYRGPRRISGSESGTPTVLELVRTGDFEAVLTWAIGLDEMVDFRVLTLDGPPRLVIDVRND
jgi:hypothetical protein